MLERKNKANLRISFLLLIIMPVYNCIMFIFQAAGITLPLRMIHIYALLLVYMLIILFKYKLPVKNLLCYFAVLLFYGISYIWTPYEAKQYFNNSDVTAILLIVAPIACICTAQVSDWKPIFDNHNYLLMTDLIIVLSLVSKMSRLNQMDYMSFSYGLLPLWGISLVSAYAFNHKIQWFFLIIGSLEGLIYGARAPLVWMIILAFMIWLIMSWEDIAKHRLSHVVPSVLLFFGLFAVVEYVIPYMVSSSLSNVSYVLRRFKISSFLESGARDQLSLACRSIISEMGLSVYGLFYDRTVLPNGIYSHNVIFEVLISLGWIFGIIFLMTVLIMIIKTFIKQNAMGKILTAYFCCTLFFRYFLSGSIFDETKFILFITMIYSLQASYSSTKKRHTIHRPMIHFEMMETDL